MTANQGDDITSAMTETAEGRMHGTVAEIRKFLDKSQSSHMPLSSGNK